MIDYESLLERIRQSPYEHLGRQSVSEINPYIIGYDWARKCWGLSNVPRRLEIEQYRKWVNSKVHLCRHNLESFCLLITEDERQGFELFFELHNSALEECKSSLIFHEDLPVIKLNQSSAIKSGSLVEFILNESMKTKPALYFGNHRWVSGIWAVCSGFLWAERDLGITDSSDAMNMELFQLWIDDRYPIARGQTWDKFFYFDAINSERWALERFYENFEMFLEGKTSAAPPKWVEQAIENIKKDSENKN